MEKHNNLKFGCEFEFYQNLMLEDEINDSLTSILKDGIKLKKNLITNDDGNMNLKLYSNKNC